MLYREFPSSSGCRVTKLKMSMFTDVKKPFKKWPRLKTKGGETRHLLPIMYKLAVEHNNGSLHDQHRVAALKCFVAFDSILDTSGFHLQTELAADVLRLAQKALSHCQWLRNWAGARKLWPLMPKHHAALHLTEDAQFLNPYKVWTFKGEDFVGKMSRMAHSVSFGTRATLLSTKLCQKYRHCLHLFLTRQDDFDDEQ